MPRERVELTRIPEQFLEQGKIFILAYEGNHTEPQYYEALKEKLKYKDYTLHIESLKRPPNDTNSAPKHVYNTLKSKKSEFNFKESDEFWMIIDKDNWKLDKWVEKCREEANFYIALSNPTFEFWLLLHLTEIDNFSEEEITLIKENKKISSKKRHIEKVLSDILGNYNKIKIPCEILLEKIEDAISRAEKLDTGDIMDNIGSHNYKLVKRFFNT